MLNVFLISCMSNCLLSTCYISFAYVCDVYDITNENEIFYFVLLHLIIPQFTTFKFDSLFSNTRPELTA